MPACPVTLMLDPSPQLFLSSRALPEEGPKKRHMAALLLVGAIALFFLVFAARMTHDWAENHLLPDILVRSDWLMTIVQAERLIMALAGLLLLLLIIPRPGRSAAKCGKAALHALLIGVAISLALPASEVGMQIFSGRRGNSWNFRDEPLRRIDPRLGWSYVPSRRVIDPEFPSRPLYVIDSHGYRVPPRISTLDRTAPSVLFAGESIMFGKGLDWQETLAGRIQALSAIQSANLAVTAYSAGQTYLRLKSELPKFNRPIAVVILFGPTLLVRDLDRNRPWIDRAGQWHPAERSWYLSRLGRVLFPYRSPAAIEEAVAADRQILLRDVALVKSRGAEPLILVPVFQPEQPREKALRKAIFGGAGIPNLIVPLDQHWRLHPDLHPDALAHAVMAQVVWIRLEKRLTLSADRK
jgi:hypothetical protein